MTQTTPTFRRRKLARRLREMRENAGLTIEEAARRLDRTCSSLGRLETGQSKVDVHIARSVMDIYDEYDADLIDMVREANRPGLLQTEGYMRALFATRNARNSRDRVANDVAARLHRKQRLTDEEFPLELAAIVDEAALRRKVGGIKVMREQLLHLAKASELNTVSVQVLPIERLAADLHGE